MPSLLEYLSPDLTLPEQYFMRQRNDDGMGAEKSLMYAVLKDGIRCFYKHVGAKRRKYRKMSIEAEEWILCIRTVCGSGYLVSMRDHSPMVLLDGTPGYCFLIPIC